jgi:ER-bound oxygenase mpaB/B'/Rubber oxygenase, catalytic domain
MVRLMHSLVRFNVLRKPDLWDVKIYGIPIPQSDQMSPAIYYTYMLAQKVLASGRTSFNEEERARVELARYRGYLLGLPEDLSPHTPQELVKAMASLYATLRRGYDEVSALQLTRSALAANLRPDDRLHNRIINNLERRFSKVYFLKNSVGGDKKEAARRGVEVSSTDRVAATFVGLYLITQLALYNKAEKIPGIRKFVERHLVTKLAKLLNRYGHAEFATDADAYRPAVVKPAMST